MPLPINITDLLHKKVVESARIEYKRDWNPEPIVHTICAFANDIDNWGGGYIIIGIEEQNGIPVFPVKGLEKSSVDDINKELLNKCNLIEPRYLPIVEEVEYDGKPIIVVWAPGGSNRPYKCPVSIPISKDHSKAFYIRKMSNTIRANNIEEKELFMLSNNIPFDDCMNMFANVADLKSSLISEFLYNVQSNLYQDSLTMPVYDTAKAMKLVDGPAENIRPLNVGLMFFNESPESFFPYTRIEVVDKPDPTGTGMTEKIFTGPLDRQLKDALNYIKNYIIKEKVIKVLGQAEAKRIYNYPYEAVEEALSNAIYHRSYQIREPITVVSTEDRLEITSLPGPDKTITDDDIKKGHMVSKRYRNRRIGDFLKELKLVEGRNTGIPTILRTMEKNRSKAPIFETDPERTFFTVTLPIHQAFLTEENTFKSTSGKVVRRSISDIKIEIVKILENYKSMSVNGLAKNMGYSKATAKVYKAVNELIADGIIAHSDPDNPNSKNQKLVLKQPD